MRKTTILLLLILPLTATIQAENKASPIKGHFAPAKISERVYVIHGPRGLPNAENQGFMNNPGFVLTGKGVVVVDPGSSVQTGEMLLQQIARITREPVIAVFNTHKHGDHWPGNQAIKAVYPNAVIYAHPKMIEDLKAGEAESWIELLQNMTDGATQGTVITLPDKAVKDKDTLTFHGVNFRIHHHGAAHTDGDIMIEVIEEKAIFLGDNVVEKQVQAGRPAENDVRGQIETIETALRTPAVHYIPGHGKSGGRQLALTHQLFLRALYTSVKKYFEQGLADFEMKGLVIKDLSAYSHWANFDDIGRLINAIYLRLEAEAF